mgnify:CR=1 FL=1
MRFLYFLESIRNPVLDAIMQFFTELGGEAVFLVLALLGVEKLGQRREKE